VIKTKTDDM